MARLSVNEPMRTAYLIINRIRQYFVRNKAIFIIFVIGGIINAAVFAYMYGNLIMAVKNKDTDDFWRKSYRVIFNAAETENGLIKPLEPEINYVSDSDIQEMIDSGIFESISIGSFSGRYGQMENTGLPLSVGTVVQGSCNLNKIKGSLELSEDADLIIDYGLIIDGGNMYSPGESVIIGGRSFRIAGVFSGAYGLSTAIITETAYKDIGCLTNSVWCTSVENWHGDNKTNVPYDFLRELFPDGYIIDNGAGYSEMESRFQNNGLTISLIIYAVSTVSFVFLLLYMADSLRRENAASLIVGANPGRISSIVFLEGSLLSFVTMLVGLFIHILLFEPFFSRFSVSASLYYRPLDYLSMACIMLLINAAVILPVSMKYKNLSPNEIRRKTL